MSESKSYSTLAIGWGPLLAAVDRSHTDLPQAEIPREKLQAILRRSFAKFNGALIEPGEGTGQARKVLRGSRKM